MTIFNFFKKKYVKIIFSCRQLICWGKTSGQKEVFQTEIFSKRYECLKNSFDMFLLKNLKIMDTTLFIQSQIFF